MKIIKTFCISCILLIGLSMFFIRALDNLGKLKIQPTQVFDGLTFSSIEKIVKYKDDYYLLETIHHRILVFDSSQTFKYQISRIGQDKGELFYPRDFVIKKGYIYVHDQKNNRIQIFDLKGNYINDFPDNYNSYGIGVNSKGEIFLGQPERGKLISVYNKNGTLINSFGDLYKLSDFFGPSLKKLDKKYWKSMNRVNIHIDRFDHVLISFVGAPFFQKYDQNGNLIFEKKIIGPEAEEIIREFRKTKKSPVRRAIDNIPTPLITTGITTDKVYGNLIISFQWNRCWIYIANSNGDKIVTLEPTKKDMLFQNIFLSESFDLILPRLSVIKNNEAYSINLKKFIERR